MSWRRRSFFSKHSEPEVYILVPLASRAEGDFRWPPPGLTRTGSTSRPSGRAERFILAMCSSVASAACVFPVETLKRADSGINWAQTTKNIGIATDVNLRGACGCNRALRDTHLPASGDGRGRGTCRGSVFSCMPR